MAPRARAKAATSSARGRLKDLTNGDDDKKTKPTKAAAAKVSNTTTIKTQREKRCPDSRPSRMTASVVAMEASAEKKETHQSEKDEPIVLKTSRQQRHNKRRRTTTTSNNNNNNNNLEDDDLDVTCDETTRSLPAKRKLLRGANQTKRVEVEEKEKETKGRNVDDDQNDDAKKNEISRKGDARRAPSARGATSTLAEYAYWAFSNAGGRRRTEERYKLDPYVKYGELFNPAMRQQVMNWMYKRSLRLSMAPETFHLAVRYCDTFLSKRECEAFLQKNGSGSEPLPAKPIESYFILERGQAGEKLSDRKVLFSTKEAGGASAVAGVGFGGLTPIFPLGDDTVNPLCNKLKRLGATCLFVAAKIVEVNPPCASTVAECTEVPTFNRSQLLLAERALLRELDFFLYRPNPRAFLDAYIDIAHRRVAKISVEERMTTMGMNNNNRKKKAMENKSDLFANLKAVLDGQKKKVEEFCELTVDLAVLSQEHLRWQPSVIAASTLALALEDEWYLSWDCADMECMVELTGYTYDDLAECSKWLLSVLKSARIAEEIQRQGAAGSRWYSKLHANEKYREVIDRVTDRDRPHMQRLESAFGYPVTSDRGILVDDFRETSQFEEMYIPPNVR